MDTQQQDSSSTNIISDDCVNLCINDNVFIISGRGEPDMVNDWVSLQLKIKNMQLPLKTTNSTNYLNLNENNNVNMEQLCLENQDTCHEYAHVQFGMTNNNANQENDKYCFTWITSNINEPYLEYLHLGTQINEFGIECFDMNQLQSLCSTNTPTNQPSVQTRLIDQTNDNDNKQFSSHDTTSQPTASSFTRVNMTTTSIPDTTTSVPQTTIATTTIATTATTTEVSESVTTEEEATQCSDDKLITREWIPQISSSIKCDDIKQTQWNAELMNWKYNSIKDETSFKYMVCTSFQLPYQSCHEQYNISSDADYALQEFVLQLPCDCEICIGSSVIDISPKHNAYSQQIEKAWLWKNINLEKGNCQYFELKFDSYIQTQIGYYYLSNENYFAKDTIIVPKPCDDTLPIVLNKFDSSSSSSSSSSDSDDYIHNETCTNIAYKVSDCKYTCDYSQVEYSSNLIDYNYDNTSDTTTFKYQLKSNQDVLPDIFCSFDGKSTNINQFHLSLPCDCTPTSNTHLISITNDIKISNNDNNYDYDVYVDKNRYSFYNLNISPNESKNITLILNGNIPLSNNGHLTIVGDDKNKCTHKLDDVYVPNPCENKCLNNAQWTNWEYYDGESCNKPCGGGKTIRKRTCVSSCDKQTIVDNCKGPQTMYTPCNTQRCHPYQ